MSQNLSSAAVVIGALGVKYLERQARFNFEVEQSDQGLHCHSNTDKHRLFEMTGTTRILLNYW